HRGSRPRRDPTRQIRLRRGRPLRAAGRLPAQRERGRAESRRLDDRCLTIQAGMASEPNPSGFDRWIEGAGWLDRPAEGVQGWILKLYEVLGPTGTTLKSLLHGTKPIGHPLHPALVSVPLGAF